MKPATTTPGMIEMMILWVIAFLTITWLRPGLPGCLVIIGGVYTYLNRATLRRKDYPAYALGLGQTLVAITAFYYLNHWLGAWGWIGLGLLCVLTASYLMWRQRRFIVKTWQSCERQLYGETAEERRERRRSP